MTANITNRIQISLSVIHVYHYMWYIQSQNTPEIKYQNVPIWHAAYTNHFPSYTTTLLKSKFSRLPTDYTPHTNITLCDTWKVHFLKIKNATLISNSHDCQHYKPHTNITFCDTFHGMILSRIHSQNTAYKYHFLWFMEG
jgi:hypothetical protein